MTLWKAGENCDVILSHPNHEALPLVCYRIPSDSIGPRVKIHFETYWSTDNYNQEIISRDQTPATVRYLWFTIIVSDEILCPDGGWYPYTALQIRKRLNDILLELTDIQLQTQEGLICGLYCDEHAIINTIYQQSQTVEIYLSTRSLSDIPITEGASIWLPDSMYNPTSLWGIAEWK